MELRFSWDDEKHRQNQFKHGISFEEAESVWFDPLAVEYFDHLHSIGEDRMIRIGNSFKNRILLVAFKEESEHETIRLISARKATSAERRFYEERI